MTLLGIVLSGLLVFGLAVRQIAYILMHGSLFEGLRCTIQEKMESENWFFEKLNELFTCKVCMTAQVAIWFVGIPLMVLAVFRSDTTLLLLAMAPLLMIPMFLLGAFLLAMAVAAVALLFWDFIEFRSKKFETLRRNYKEQIRELREQLATQHRQNLTDGGCGVIGSVEAEEVQTEGRAK